MPTNGHEGYDAGKPTGMPTHAAPKHDAEHPGYETQDVNVGGIITFLAGLSGFVIVFFIFCFFMGKAINYAFLKQDGEPTKWKADHGSMGMTPHGEKREDLASNAAMEQKQLAQMAQTFPTPRLEADDGNQDTADLHAREDLLLENYSTSSELPAGTVRIPIDRAMELIVQRGLPAASASATPRAGAAPKTLMAGDRELKVQAPLTSGFARTGFELDTMQTRAQRLEYEKASK